VINCTECPHWKQEKATFGMRKVYHEAAGRGMAASAYDHAFFSGSICQRRGRLAG
jgi:hypothetical protein